MSYIRASLVGNKDTTTSVGDYTSTPTPRLDMNLDDEILDFVLALINEVNDLDEGEALVVWKEIF